MYILVYIQGTDSALHNISYEIASKAISLSKSGKMATVGVYVGNCNDKTMLALSKTGLDKIFIYQKESAVTVEDSVWAVSNCINRLNPEIVLIGATLEGRAIAPIIGARYKTGVTADCTALELSCDGLLVQTRPAFGEQIMADIITPITRPQIATVRQGIFEKQTEVDVTKHFEVLQGERAENKFKIISEDITTDKFEDNKVILAVGVGVKSKENILILERICKANGWGLMCSRAVVEQGWLKGKYQIGLSGSTVAPQLLITLGVRGSVQFMAGIKQSKKIIAINTDARAPIMQIADKAICCDANEIIGILMTFAL